MDQARRRQFDHLGTAKRELLSWANANGIPLVHVEFVVPFVPTDFAAVEWLFFDTGANVSERAGTFCVDSHENVERNYKGSYFYRLR